MSASLRYFLKKPAGQRRTFGLACYQIIQGKKVYQEAAPRLRATLDSINSQYLQSIVSISQATVLIKELIKSEYKSSGTRLLALRASDISIINQQIFEAFWTEVYAPRYLEDTASPRYECLKALRMIEPCSLASASVLELQAAVRASAASSGEIRRATGRLNQMLKFLKRDIKMNKPKAGLRSVAYVTYEEFWSLYAKLPAEQQDLAVVLFATGMRLSEALALGPNDYKDGAVTIEKQLSKTGLKLPKRDKVGRSVVLAFGHEAMLRWVQEPDKESYRYRIYPALITASQGKIGAHDLRHSHAIYLLSQGANLTQVALQLRNRMDICQMYYVGFAHNEGTLDALKRLLK